MKYEINNEINNEIKMRVSLNEGWGKIARNLFLKH